MPAVRFVFALSLLLAPLAAQATEASFDRSLAAVHTKMASGKWDQAIAGLDQILIDHKNQVYVQAQSAGIANDYRTSCFYQAYPKPKLKDY